MKKLLKHLVNGKPANDKEKYHMMLALFAATLATLLMVIIRTGYTFEF